MEQYSVLLVDDEEEVTQVILQKIDWESLGFHIIRKCNERREGIGDG